MSLHDYKEYNRLVCHLYRISKGERTTLWIGARRGDVSIVNGSICSKKQACVDSRLQRPDETSNV